MSEQKAERSHGGDRRPEANRVPLFLDEWTRAEILGRADGAAAARLRGLPLRGLIRHATAVGLAATLERALRHSLHYARKLAAQPGGATVERLIAELRDLAELWPNGCPGALPYSSPEYPGGSPGDFPGGSPHDFTGDDHASSPEYPGGYPGGFPGAWADPGGLVEERLYRILSALPFTWPEELAAAPESFLAVSHSEVEGLISQRSSGTTGGAAGAYKRIFCTAGDQEGSVGFFASGMRYLAEPERGDGVALLLSAGGRGGGNLADLFGAAMRRLGLPCLTPQNPADENATLAELAAFRPSCLVCAPRQAMSLFRSDAGEQLGRLRAGLKNVLISGDRLGPALRRILERESGAEVFTHYGMVESGLGTAVECRRRNGCHYREADFLIEIITPDGVSHPFSQWNRSAEGGAADPAGMSQGPLKGSTPWGEITLTSLSRRGSPLIRYRTGDAGRIILERCACGSALRRLEIGGRIDDRAETPAQADDTASPRLSLTRDGLDAALYSLPWVKDYQALPHPDAPGREADPTLIVLLNAQAPDDARAGRDLREALARLDRPAPSRRPGISLRLSRDRAEFIRLFPYSPKRAFPRGPGPGAADLFTPGAPGSGGAHD